MNPLIKDRRGPVRPAGAPASGWLSLLDQGARLLQDTAPLRGFDVYVVGFHCARDDPDMQMEAHHYCRVVNDDLLQCVLFDGNTRQANLIGVEYMVSERLFGTLPEAERELWHPHNFEILSGQLAAPGLPVAVETAFLALLMNSYGKTWHTWHTGSHTATRAEAQLARRDGQVGRTAEDLPLGEPALMWSFNREGECDEALIDDRDSAMDLDVGRRRRARRRLVRRAHPQRGVDAMADQFTGTTPLPGVVDTAATGHPTGHHVD